MARTPGATNRTPREIRADSENQKKEARLKERIIAKDRQIAALKQKNAPARTK